MSSPLVVLYSGSTPSWTRERQARVVRHNREHTTSENALRDVIGSVAHAVRRATPVLMLPSYLLERVEDPVQLEMSNRVIRTYGGYRVDAGTTEEQLEHMLHETADPGPGCGSLSASTLLVGEPPHPEWPSRLPNWPFVSTRRTGCSYWLTSLVLSCGCPADDLYWVNAQGSDRADTDHYWIESRRFKRVIAMGRVAAQWLARVGCSVAWEEVPHPQFWKRFHYRKPYPLLNLLGGKP